jgi:hypothetical protein
VKEVWTTAGRGKEKEIRMQRGNRGQKKNGNKMYDETLPDHETSKGSQITAQIDDLDGNFVFTD